MAEKRRYLLIFTEDDTEPLKAMLRQAGDKTPEVPAEKGVELANRVEADIANAYPIETAEQLEVAVRLQEIAHDSGASPKA